MKQNKKTFYFVRHGESEANVGGLRQGGACPLTPQGFKQAELIGRRLESLPIDIIVSSTFTRAKQTAETISSITHHEIIYSDLLVERDTASRWENTSTNDPASKEAIALIQKNYGDLDWKYEDAESGRDLLNRAKRALEYLVALPQEHVVVVTHGYFLRFLLAEMMFKGELQGDHLVNFLSALVTKNTGVTVCNYFPSVNAWKLLTWNDHAHLSEFVELELPEGQK